MNNRQNTQKKERKRLALPWRICIAVAVSILGMFLVGWILGNPATVAYPEKTNYAYIGDYGGKLYFLRWVGEQPDKFRLFLYGGNLHFFCRLFDPLDCVRIVQNCCKLCTFLQQVVFIWHGSFFFMLYFRGNDRRIQCNRIALNKN